MIRPLKRLVVLLTVAMATCAVVASFAQATQGTLTVDPNVDATVHSTQIGNHKYVLTDNNNLQTTCTTVTSESTSPSVRENRVTTGDTSITVQSTYQGCTYFGLSATVNTSACHEIIKFGTTTAANTWDYVIDTQCGSGAVVITTLTCEVKYKSQTGLSTGSATNSGGVGTTDMDILLHANIVNIKYEVTKDGIGCPLKGVGSYTQADFTGTTTLKADEEGTGNAVGITLH